MRLINLFHLRLMMLIYLSISQEIHPENPIARKRIKTLTKSKKFDMRKETELLKDKNSNINKSNKLPPKLDVVESRTYGDNGETVDVNIRDSNDGRPSIKVLRNIQNDIQILAPPCSLEVDLYCYEIRDMGGTYKEMQTCLLRHFNQLEPKCQLITNSSKYCDFQAIHEICHEVNNQTVSSSNPYEIANCIENFLIEYKKGNHLKKNQKIIKSFLSFSHNECINILRNLGNEFIKSETKENIINLSHLNDKEVKNSLDDKNNGKEFIPLTMLEFAEMVKNDINFDDVELWKQNKAKHPNIMFMDLEEEGD